MATRSGAVVGAESSSRSRSSPGGARQRDSATTTAARAIPRTTASTTSPTRRGMSLRPRPTRRRCGCGERAYFSSTSPSTPASTAARPIRSSSSSTTFATSRSKSRRGSSITAGNGSSRRSRSARLCARTATGEGRCAVEDPSGSSWRTGASIKKAGDRARTGELELGRLACYQLHHARVWLR